MISAQTRCAFVARENRYPLFRIMLHQPVAVDDGTSAGSSAGISRVRSRCAGIARYTCLVASTIWTPAKGSDSAAPTRSHAIADLRNQPPATGGMNSASPHAVGVNQVCLSKCVICEREYGRP